MKAVKERKKPKKYVTYPLVVEEEIVQFIEGHPCLYNQKLCEFRNAYLKNLAWQRLLEQINSNNGSLNTNMHDLRSWYKNVRTEVGKVWGWRPAGGNDREARVVVDQVSIPEQPHQYKGGMQPGQRGEYTIYFLLTFLD